jgi:hypothetical protein
VLQPSLLATLTSDLQVTSSRLLGLKQLLPKANVSAIVASRPTLLLQDTAEVQQSIEALQELLQVGHPEQLDRCVCQRQVVHLSSNLLRFDSRGAAVARQQCCTMADCKQGNLLRPEVLQLCWRMDPMLVQAYIAVSTE